MYYVSQNQDSLFDTGTPNLFYWEINAQCLFSFSASEASSSVSGVSSASSTVKKVEVAKKDLASVVAPPKDLEAAKNSVSENGDDESAAGGAVEGEDTMQNLRKTFAGIFGDIKQ